MAIKQLTVFVENRKGTMVSVTDILSQNNINIRALSIAETQNFGILRLIVNDNETAEFYKQWYVKVKNCINNKLWDEEDGFYFDYDSFNGCICNYI